MNSKITFFNIGNADTTLIRLSSGKNVLWDYANMQGEKHCDLSKELNKRMPKSYFDVVCFTHCDRDHVNGIGDYFYLEHAAKYQSAERKKINDLWVPAATLLESRNDYCDCAKILKAEAKHRFLVMKRNIKVFSKPDELKSWVDEQGVKFSDVSHLIVDAGKLVPGWNKEQDGIEFFVHSPFKGQVDNNKVIDRNNAAIIVQAVFGNKTETKMILGSDADSDTLADIVKISKWNKNDIRLEWDIFHLCHHCSHNALNNLEKGRTKTMPVPEVKWLMETQARQKCLLISPSDKIPSCDTNQPPHKQTYNYYKEDVADKNSGMIKVTMEHPNMNLPKPMDYIINDSGPEESMGLTDAEKMAGATLLTKTSAVSGNWCKL